MYRSPEMPQEPEKPGAKSTLISRMGTAVLQALKGTVEWACQPEAVPFELRDMLTMPQVKDAMKIYYEDYKRDYNQPTTIDTPEGPVQSWKKIKDKIRMDSIGDFDRRLGNIKSIFEIHFGVCSEDMNDAQRIAFNIYCLKLIGMPGMSQI